MTALFAALALIPCLFFAYRIAFGRDRMDPPATARALRKHRKASQLQLPRNRVWRPWK